MLKGDLLFSALVFVVSLFLFWVTGSFTGQESYGKLGPAFWPQIILVILAVMSGIVSIGTIKKLSREKGWGESLMTMDRGKVRFFSAIGLIVAYIFLLRIMGFITMTPLFMIGFMILLGEKSKGWMIGVSIGLTATIIILFTKAMYVPLPRGVWLFREFSLLFY